MTYKGKAVEKGKGNTELRGRRRHNNVVGGCNDEG